MKPQSASLQALLAILLSTVPLHLPAEETVPVPPKTDTWSFMSGVDLVPALQWSAEPIVNHTYIDYDFVANAMTTYSGSVVDEELGLKYGIKLTFDDNLIGKFNNLAGYIGYKDYILKLRTGRMEGTAAWDGALAPGQPAEVDFDNRFFTLDMILWMNDGGLYTGASYTSFALPMQIDTLLTPGGLENQYNGVGFCDPDYKISAYSFIFGIDTFTNDMITKGGSGKAITGFMTTQDSIGFGYADISSKGVEYAEALNPGTSAVSPHMFAGFVEYDLSFGIKSIFIKDAIRVSIGVGYNVGGIAIFSFGGGVDRAGKLGFDGSFEMVRHGPMFKLYAAF